MLASAAVAASGGSGETIELTGTVRDFRERTVDGGHPDFERLPEHGYRLYTGNVATFLNDDGKPVFTGEGVGLRKSWRDHEDRKICPCVVHGPGRHQRVGVGGVHRAKSQFIDLDRLGLIQGTTCRLDIFYADRHRMHAKLGIVTNVSDLRTAPARSQPKTDTR